MGKAPILILDEPVTGLDAITEAQLNETLVRLMHGKTTFIIAHRFSTIEKADLILVIEEGQVIEQGTHAELLARSSHYRDLYELQYGKVESVGEEPPSQSRYENNRSGLLPPETEEASSQGEDQSGQTVFSRLPAKDENA